MGFCVFLGRSSVAVLACFHAFMLRSATQLLAVAVHVLQADLTTVSIFLYQLPTRRAIFYVFLSNKENMFS